MFSRRQKATTSLVLGQRQSLLMIDDVQLRFLSSAKNLVSLLSCSSPPIQQNEIPPANTGGIFLRTTPAASRAITDWDRRDKHLGS